MDIPNPAKVPIKLAIIVSRAMKIISKAQDIFSPLNINRSAVLYADGTQFTAGKT